MEKEWEDFWVTGSVKDYLNYKNCYKEESKQGNREFHGTDNYGDRDGDKHHANIGI